ncbi:MAG: TonB-system energizer ExbB [Campylobacter sp.]|nr:TonB-system energizer ExbB [Campylobacter sp.]
MEVLSEYIDYIIFGVLGFMSFISLSISIERLIFYLRFKQKNYTNFTKLKNDLSKNLTALGIIGSNAPYVGLLGTVIGIIITFFDMGKSGNFETTVIMSGLSTALYATALGLLVAIPSLIVYGFCVRKVQKELDIFKENKGRS